MGYPREVPSFDTDDEAQDAVSAVEEMRYEAESVVRSLARLHTLAKRGEHWMFRADSDLAEAVDYAVAVLNDLTTGRDLALEGLQALEDRQAGDDGVVSLSARAGLYRGTVL